jgi:hypothetical protein
VYFNFYPVWSTYSQKNLHGAKGSDPITFVASGLRTILPNLYRCKFSAENGDTMISAATSATSQTKVTCITPQFGGNFTWANTAVVLYEDYFNASDFVLGSDQLIAEERSGIQLGYLTSAATFVNNYLFYQVLSHVIHYPNGQEFPDGNGGGRSIGNESVSLRAYGLVKNIEKYQLRFTAVSDSGRTDTSKYFSAQSANFIKILTPQWGRQHIYGNTTVELLSDGVALSSVAFDVLPTDELYFRFDEEWSYVDIELGVASGGTHVTFHGNGFDYLGDREEDQYVCRFRDPANAAQVIDSNAATLYDSQTLMCITPAWGGASTLYAPLSRCALRTRCHELT